MAVRMSRAKPVKNFWRVPNLASLRKFRSCQSVKRRIRSVFEIKFAVGKRASSLTFTSSDTPDGNVHAQSLSLGSVPFLQRLSLTRRADLALCRELNIAVCISRKNGVGIEQVVPARKVGMVLRHVLTVCLLDLKLDSVRSRLRLLIEAGRKAGVIGFYIFWLNEQTTLAPRWIFEQRVAVGVRVRRCNQDT